MVEESSSSEHNHPVSADPPKSKSKGELILAIILFLLPLVIDMKPWLAITIWLLIAGLSGHLIWRSQWTNDGLPTIAKIIACMAIAVFISWQVVDVLKNQPETAAPHSRIVVSKFLIKRFDAHDTNSGYQINLYLINRGNTPGYVPVNNFSFWSVEKPSSDTEIEEEMSKVIKLALQQLPMRTTDREQVEVGVEYHVMLPKGLTPTAYAMISSGQKVFYLFAVLTYYDDSLPVGRFWVSEYCGWQSKDLSYIQLCKGHNKTWLYKN